MPTAQARYEGNPNSRRFSELFDIHLWAANHQHQILLHRHQWPAAQRSPLYVWCPPVVPHRASTPISLILTWPVSRRENFSGGGWGRFGQAGWDRVGWFLFLLSPASPSLLHLVFYLCLNIMFTCSSLTLFHFLAIVFCPLCCSPLVPLLPCPPPFLSLHHSASHCCD